MVELLNELTKVTAYKCSPLPNSYAEILTPTRWYLERGLREVIGTGGSSPGEWAAALAKGTPRSSLLLLTCEDAVSANSMGSPH